MSDSAPPPPNPYGKNPYGQSPPSGQPWVPPHEPHAAPSGHHGSPYDGGSTYAPSVSYAHWGKRAGAYALDTLILIPFYAVVAITSAFVGGTQSTTYGASGQPIQTTEPINVAALVVLLVVYAAMFAFVVWNLWIRQGRTGQSLGKTWLSIRVVKDSDHRQPPGIGLNFGRALLHILDALPCYLGYFWPLWDQKRQTFADKIVSTVVIDV
jgi:uncharacterized RDD family membrane protein YckC